MEKHEVLVLATAQHMLDTGDWIVPYFNHEPRLQKPPLNYWLTALLATLDPFSQGVTIYHGRMISLLAALGGALLLFHLVRLSYPTSMALGASLILLSSVGWQLFAHNARPDMLYATLSLAQLTAWSIAWAKKHSSLWICLGWLAAALATLSKGPQVPIVILAANLIFLWREQGMKASFKVFHPVGLVLFLLLVLPWWLALKWRLDALGIDLRQQQISGALLLNLASWKEIFSLYYIWHGLGLLLPFSLSLLWIVPRLRKIYWPHTTLSRWLGWVLLMWLLVFTLGGHYRKHYLLPVLPLLSMFLFWAWQNMPILQNKRATVILWGICSLFFTVNLFYMLQKQQWLLAILALVLATLTYFMVRQQHRLALIIALGFNVGLAHAALPLNPERLEEQRFAQHIGQQLPPHAKLLEWQAGLPVLPYFVSVPIESKPDEWRPKMLRHGPTYLVMPFSKRTMLPPQAHVLSHSGPTRKHPKGLILVRLE